MTKFCLKFLINNIMIKEAKLKKATQFPKKWFGLEPKLYREVSLFYGTLYLIKVTILESSVHLLYPTELLFPKEKDRIRTCDRMC